MAFDIRFLGHSTLRVTLASGEKVLFDPWLETNPSCPADAYGMHDVDLLCVTHGHGDHTGSVIEVAKRSGAKVCAPYELLQVFIKHGVPEGQIVPMNKGGTVAVGNVRVTLTHAFHSSSYVGEDGTHYYAGEPCGFVLRTADGDSLYNAGDTALFSDMKLIGELYKPRVALLPIGDRFTMGPEEAALGAKWLNAKVVVPIHWGTFELLTGTPQAFEKAIGDNGPKVVTLKPGESAKL